MMMPGYSSWQMGDQMPSTFFRPLALTIWGIIAAVITFSNEISPTRIFITLSFLLVCPGLAFTWRLMIKNPLFELVLATGLSIAIDTVVAAIMIYAHSWSLEWSLVIIVCLTIIGAILNVFALFEMRSNLKYVGFLDNE